MLLRFNGERIRNLSHLLRLVKETKQPYYRFDFEGDGSVFFVCAC